MKMILFWLIFTFSIQLSTCNPNCYSQIIRGYYYQITCQNLNMTNFKGLSFRSEAVRVTLINSSMPILKSDLFNPMLLLEKIYANNSKVETIETGAFGKLRKIQELHLADNSIRNITRGCFNSLSTLRLLDLSNNQINSVEQDSFHGSTSLENIILQNNTITRIPPHLFQPLVNIHICDISKNRLKYLDFHLPKERSNKLPFILNVKNNQIEKIDCEIFTADYLTVLDLSGNLLTVLNGSCFPYQLEQAAFTRNNISNITNLARLARLTNLDLGFNKIEKLSPQTFHSNSDLLNLRLDNNRINKLPVGIFNNSSRIQTLDLSNNFLDYLDFGVFHNLSRLSTLNLSYNLLEFVEESVFNPLTQLKMLNVSYNKLTHLNLMRLDYNKNLQLVDLLGNQIPCQKLADMVVYKLKLRIVNGTYFNVTNVRGIPCKDSNLIKMFHDIYTTNQPSTTLKTCKVKQSEDFVGIAEKIDRNNMILMFFGVTNIILFVVIFVVQYLNKRKGESRKFEDEVQL